MSTTTRRTCAVAHCERHTKAQRLCGMHYQRLLKHGSTDFKPRSKVASERLQEIGWTETPAGCWEWAGGRDRNGYGVLTIHSRNWLAHRAAWAVANADDPEGLVVRHHCDNPPCVNPDHLELGTQLDNVRDMMARGRFWSSGRTECRNGHDVTAPGATRRVTKRDGSTYSTCVECGRDRLVRFHARRRAMSGVSA
jgi:hypothetical protein